MSIIFNEDPNHYIITRYRAGVTQINENDLRDFIRQYRDTNISDFLVCVNAGQPFYKTVRMKSIIDRLSEWEADGRLAAVEKNDVVMCVKLLRDACDRGIDIFGIWLDEIRKCGMRAWVSVRMNDIHDAEDHDAFLPSDFVKAHSEYMRAFYRQPSIHPEYALDYSVAEVREQYLNLIEETLDTYDCDGIELDYMREPYCFAIGREQQGLKTMTKFVGQVFTLVKKSEKRRGHRIVTGVRVPSAPRDAMLLGLDVVEWLNRGYVDRLFVTPHWSGSDGNMPIDLWKSIISGRDIRLAAGLELLLDAYNRRGRKYNYIDAGSAIGFACAYDALGADDVYLFNYMDCINESELTGGNDVLSKRNYAYFLRTAGDSEKMINAPRRHVVTFFDTWIPGEPPRKPLPLRVSADEGATVYSALRIPTGVIPQGKEVSLCLGFEKGLSHGDDVNVYAACRRCRLIGSVSTPYHAYDDLDYYAYEIENDGDLPTVFIAEIGALRGTATVHWAEIDVK
ncbi:MAG: hypothetical protein MJ101_01175 [Clostridia bacterium]|nr:hypothetical protein [Clostridia bacterium]